MTDTIRRLSDRPITDLLAVDTEMAAVTLRVADLDRMRRYYAESVGLSVLADDTADGAALTVLGRLGVPIVVLEHAPELRHAAEHQAGLYHTAIVFPTEQDLATAVYSVASDAPRSFTGSADHLVSNAFYFDDPEGNGVELYWDRPRSAWEYIDGSPKMGSSALDPNAYLREHLDETARARASERAAKVGHVHLSVGDVPTARAFYVDRLGFEVVGDFGTALFVSAGGYHHHMAMNVWQSRGAGRRQLTLGLGLVRIEVPTGDDLGGLAERLAHHGVSTSYDGDTLRFDDPWANAIEVRAAG